MSILGGSAVCQRDKLILSDEYEYFISRKVVYRVEPGKLAVLMCACLAADILHLIN